MSDESYYELIGVVPDAGKDEIRDAYLARTTSLEEEQTKELAAKRPREDVLRRTRDQLGELRRAWQVLSDPYQRGRYDMSIGVGADAAGAVLMPDSEAGLDEVADVAVPARSPKQMTARERREARLSNAGLPVTTNDGTVLEVAKQSRRVMAAMIDVFISAALVSSVFAAAYYLADARGTTSKYYAQSLSALGIAVLYWVIPSSRTGQTIGKRLTYIMLVDRSTGDLPSMERIVARYLLPLAVGLAFPGFFGPVALISGFSFIMSRDGLSLLDRIGRTAVIVARYQPARPSRRR